MDERAAFWDARYSGAELVWSGEPNRWVAETFAARSPGRALDLATGEGRHALHLARAGWQVTAVDFSAAGLARARALQEEHAPQTVGRVSWVEADVVTYEPERRAYDAVVIAYLHLPAGDRRRVHRTAAEALAVGGTLLVVGHDATNPTHGHGGPQDPDVLFTSEDVLTDLAGLDGLDVVRAELVRRDVGGGRVALDALVEVCRRR